MVSSAHGHEQTGANVPAEESGDPEAFPVSTTTFPV